MTEESASVSASLPSMTTLLDCQEIFVSPRLLWNFDQRTSKWEIIAAIQLDCISNKVSDPGYPVVSPCLLNHQPSCLRWIVEVQTRSLLEKQIIFYHCVDR